MVKLYQEMEALMRRGVEVGLQNARLTKAVNMLAAYILSARVFTHTPEERRAFVSSVLESTKAGYGYSEEDDLG